MRKSIIVTVIILGSLVFAGCNTVKIYSDQSLKKNTGLKFYTAKPYLQVERNNTDGSIVKATIIYMPDLANPQYMAVKPGFGSAKVSMKFKDGYLESFGFDSDSEIPELLESAGSLISDAAGAVTDIYSIKGVSPSATSATTTEVYEIIMTSEGTTLKKIDI